MPKVTLPPAPAPPPSTSEHFLRLITRLGRFAWDFAGLIFLALALMTLLGLLTPQLASGLLSWWAKKLTLWLGWGSYWFVLGCGSLGIWLLRRNPESRTSGRFWLRVFSLEAAAFASLALLSVLGGGSIDRADASLDGGRIGWGLRQLVQIVLEPVGLGGLLWQGLCLSVFFFVALFVGLGLSRWLGRLGTRLQQSLAGEGAAASRYVEASPVVSEGPLQNAAPAPATEATKRRKLPVLPPQFRKSFRLQPDDSRPVGERPPRDERLPGLDLLVNEQFNRPDERNINLTAGLIEKTLADFGIPAKVVGFRVGPTVTQFAVEPGYLEKDKTGQEGDANRQKVRVAQISSLGRDLALALAAERLRIEAPVPGRPYVGIEVPNPRSSVVRLRPMLESESFHKVGFNAGDCPGAGCLRAAGGGRPGAHAAPADRRHDRLGQIGLHRRASPPAW